MGLLIANEPTENGSLRVVAPLKGGPADRAGVQAGDEVLSINGNAIQGLSGQEAAQMLKGANGTEVCRCHWLGSHTQRTQGFKGSSADWS